MFLYMYRLFKLPLLMGQCLNTAFTIGTCRAQESCSPVTHTHTHTYAHMHTHRDNTPPHTHTHPQTHTHTHKHENIHTHTHTHTLTEVLKEVFRWWLSRSWTLQYLFFQCGWHCIVFYCSGESVEIKAL